MIMSRTQFEIGHLYKFMPSRASEVDDDGVIKITEKIGDGFRYEIVEGMRNDRSPYVFEESTVFAHCLIPIEEENFMNNYLCFNGKKIPLTKEQIDSIKNQFAPCKRLGDVPVGELAKIGEHEYIVLDHVGEYTRLLMRDFLTTMKFGKTCDFKTSDVKDELDKFARKLAEVVGGDNIFEHAVDLTADDGLKDYGSTTALVSLLTANLYRNYVEIIDKYKVDGWWWLATPFSTPKRGFNNAVKCVSPSGFTVNNYGGDSSSDGVRPILNFVSSIFCEEKESATKGLVKLKVQFWRTGSMVEMQVLEQDDALRGASLLYHASNGITFFSEINPYLDENKIFIRGKRRGAGCDDFVSRRFCDSEEAAIELIDTMSAAINEFNVWLKNEAVCEHFRKKYKTHTVIVGG